MTSRRSAARLPADPALSELQLAILHVLWERPGATVQDVHSRLSRSRELAPSTVATVLTRLEARGVVDRSKSGRQFRYTARISHERTSASMLDDLARRVFRGDATALVCRLLESGAIRDAELDRVSALIEERRKQTGPRAGQPRGQGRRP
jgi:predicted transcriptional regulator